MTLETLYIDKLIKYVPIIWWAFYATACDEQRFPGIGRVKGTAVEDKNRSVKMLYVIVLFSKNRYEFYFRMLFQACSYLPIENCCFFPPGVDYYPVNS